MSEAAVVAEIRMLSPVGQIAAEQPASVRPGTRLFAESAIVDKRVRPFTLAEVAETALPPLHVRLDDEGLTSREVRMVRRAEPALRECLAALPPGAAATPL